MYTTILQAVDDTKHEKYNHVVPPHGTWGRMLSERLPAGEAHLDSDYTVAKE